VAAASFGKVGDVESGSASPSRTDECVRRYTSCCGSLAGLRMGALGFAFAWTAEGGRRHMDCFRFLRPSGALFFHYRGLPTACAVGCVLAPLCGWIRGWRFGWVAWLRLRWTAEGGRRYTSRCGWIAGSGMLGAWLRLCLDGRRRPSLHELLLCLVDGFSGDHGPDYFCVAHFFGGDCQDVTI
jgi:hypothetical protein